MKRQIDTAAPQRLRLKASLISSDGGKTWVVSRQYYVCDIISDRLLDIRLTGLEMALVLAGKPRSRSRSNSGELS